MSNPKSGISKMLFWILISILSVIATALGYSLWTTSTELTNTKASLFETQRQLATTQQQLATTQQQLASTQQQSGTTKSGCFIATAAYGTPLAKEIDILRSFRDKVLINNTFGSYFVDLYYTTSPPIANIIASNEFLRWYTRTCLIEPIVLIVDATKFLWLQIK